MNIPVTEQSSLWFLERHYIWKYPRKSWNDPEQVLLGVKVGYHSRFDQDHYSQCEACWEDNQDFLEQCRMDEQDNYEEEYHGQY